VRGYSRLDEQLARFSDQLIKRVGLHDDESTKVATLIAGEVRFLDPASRSQVLDASPVPLRARLDELGAFQGWMDFVHAYPVAPAVVRAQVIVQNYICFVYLGESCFIALRKASRPDSVTRRCCKYLTDNPVRAFRNAIAHSNWTYLPNFRGLVFWAKKGSDPNEALSRFEVSDDELGFWQALSRSVAYAAYTSINAVGLSETRR
jgi:hypothetical protein